MQKKAEVATDITAINNDYVTNTSLSSQLKSKHIATEVTGIDNKTKKKMLVIFYHLKINYNKKNIL